MEKKRSNAGLIIALILFILISLGLGAYICFDKYLNNKTAETKTTEVDKNDNNSATEQEEEYQVLQLSPISGIAVVYNGEVYVNIYDSNPNITQIYGDISGTREARQNYKEYSFGNLTVTPHYLNDGASDKWLKLNAKDVKNIINNEYGQAYTNVDPKYGVVILHSDNTVSFIKMDALLKGTTDVTKLDVSDVARLENEATSGGYATNLIKTDGTKIFVNTLIH